MKNRYIILIAMLHVCVGLLSNVHGLVPPPDGGYPGGNTAEGQAALLSLTSGTFNTGVGFFALRSNTEGQFNTAVGAGTLLANVGNPSAVEGVQNTAVGAGALLSNTTGAGNTATGAFALFSNTTGGGNTATGVIALNSNTTGGANTATGNQALVRNTTGNENTADGVFALQGNTTGDANTANGFFALALNTTGIFNTASGAEALEFNTTGSLNTALGRAALNQNTTGHDNTACGIGSLSSNTIGINNTAVGSSSLNSNTTGSNNMAFGVNAGGNVTTASNVICIGANVFGANVDDSCFIGNIRDALVAPDAVQVLIDSAGKLGTTSGSSRRFKTEIKRMDSASETILALAPVTFRYKGDRTNTPQFGLIAEEVARANPGLVVHDKNGELLTVRYDAVNAMLLNEFLKEHRKVEAQQGKIEKQEHEMQIQRESIAQLKWMAAQQEKQLQWLNAGLQQVTAQLEIRKDTPKMVRNN